ncbi:MAG: UDP-glucose dehydrogenase family protein [Phototrophicaceae bacterium]|jgi:UDPglucose 6-dehydrogenase
MKKICVIGVGYVGLTTGTCFADLGNRVVGVDVSEAKINDLNNGGIPIYEPGLAEMVVRNRKSGRLSFTTSYAEGLDGADYVFICVGTPQGADGEAELRYVRAAAETIARTMTYPLIIVNKSTVPVGTGDWVAEIVTQNQPTPIDFSVVSCPEFLREGSAIRDFMAPDRTVLGSQDRVAAEAVAQLFLTLRAPIVMTDLRTAEMIKYASNAFLATRISFINEIANICEAVGADVTEVAQGMGFDHRIGHHFLSAGVGYGGSCFPKDVKALAYIAESNNVDPRVLNSVMDVNDFQRKRIMEKVREELTDLKGKRIALLGLAFKENTDDLRESPAMDIAQHLLNGGATVYAYDPVAMENAARELPGLNMCGDAYGAAEGADALVIATPWNEFKNLDMDRVMHSMAHPILIDGRNMYSPDLMRDLGFRYRGVGRGYQGTGINGDNAPTTTVL